MKAEELNKKILYVSYDGMCDPLGQSQVIPYLIKLSKKSFGIHILSAEKEQNYRSNKDYVSKLLSDNNISWTTVNYSKNPPVFSTANDIRKLKKSADKLCKINKYDIVHCRSYIAAFVGEYLQKKYSCKFLFDMRGFYPDERVDGGLWKQSNIIYRLIYKYFKKKEKDFLLKSDYTISLTETAKDIMLSKYPKLKIKHIPCCADLELFNYENYDIQAEKKAREYLGFSDDDLIISYLGSIGTWYMLDEMLMFFKFLKQSKANAKFLFITYDNEELILKSAKKYGITSKDIKVISGKRTQVPEILNVSNLSIFFIKPVFSKKASSPTKLAEILGMGIPIICNSKVGDMEKYVENEKTGFIINDFNENNFKSVTDKITQILKPDRKFLRNISKENFSLEKGVKSYEEVYNNI